MAIFTGKTDFERVPMLSQLAQIDVANLVELQFAVFYVAMSSVARAGVETQEARANLPILERFHHFQQQEAQDRALIDDSVLLLPTICDVVRRILNGIATANAVPADCLAWVNSRAVSAVFKYAPLTGDPLTERGKQLVSPHELAFKPVHRIATIEAIVYDELTNVVYPWLLQIPTKEGGDELAPIARICPECSNPFVVTNLTMTWCSHRCASRNSIRKRRAEQKEKSTNKTNMLIDLPSTKGYNVIKQGGIAYQAL